MGKKYIIEIPEDSIGDYIGSTHLLIPYMMAGHKGHLNTRLNITPYTEPDTEQARDDGWATARTIAQMTEYERQNIFGDPRCLFIFEQYTCNKAAEKIQQYKQKKEQQIQVGDEVYAFDKRFPRIVTAVCEEIDCGCPKEYAMQITKAGKWAIDEIKNLHKTGRHFSEITKILQKMNEEE